MAVQEKNGIQLTAPVGAVAVVVVWTTPPALLGMAERGGFMEAVAVVGHSRSAAGEVT